MSFQSHHPSRSGGMLCLTPTLLALATLVSACPALAQFPGASQQAHFGGSLNTTFTDLQVSVRDSTGGPLSVNAFVRISSNFNQIRMTAPVQDGGAASFSGIPAGDYDVIAEAPGYATATEHASILIGSTSFMVYVYMHPEGEISLTDPRAAKPLMTPRLQGEIDKALEKTRKQQFDQALAHLSKAEKMAPANPDVQYLIGMLEYQRQHFDLARARFEKAISIYPTHERALVLLGELQLRAGQSEQSVQTLEKAFRVNGADWRVHYLLGSAFSALRDYDKALAHALHAAELSKGKFPSVQLLIGRILLQENRRDEAKAVLRSIVKSFPNDPAAKDAQSSLAQLDKPTLIALAVTPGGGSAAEPDSTSSTTLEDTLPAPPPPTIPPFVRPWSPPDIDAREYVLARDVACAEDQVVQRIQMRTQKQLENFEKFSATEHIEHQEIDAYGNPSSTRTKDFTYIVFVDRPKPNMLFLNEERDGQESLAEFPTKLATRGLVGLGVFFFSPEYQSDFSYKCEGLSQWRGQAAWQIRLEQRREVTSRVMTWRNRRGVYPVPLKARVWVAANTYDVLHIETDLRDPVPDVELSLEHLVIDYGPVNFVHGGTSLWLPWYADMYLQLHNKRYHHRHTLTNYALFSVDTDHHISAPKDAPKDEPPPQG